MAFGARNSERLPFNRRAPYIRRLILSGTTITKTITKKPETFDNRYRLPVDAYYHLKNLGYLQGKFEILDGEVIDKIGQNPPHATTLTRLLGILVMLFGAEFLRIQSPITLPSPDGLYNEPEPDAAITREQEPTYNHQHPTSQDILAIIEVSDTTLRTDLGVKAHLYARAAIPEYWVVDLQNRQLHIHRIPADDEYTEVTIHDETEIVAFVTRPDFPIPITQILPASR